MQAVGPDRMSPGAELILGAAARPDPRPLDRGVGRRQHAGAGAAAPARPGRPLTSTRSSPGCASTPSPIKTMRDRGSAASSRRSTTSPCRRPPTAINRCVRDLDRHQRRPLLQERARRRLLDVPREWVDANIRSKGPLGKWYPYPCCIHEGDTPSFLGLIDNGLASAMSPAYGGWGGRYVWRRFYGEPGPSWTQGGDAYPGRDSSRDTVTGVDGRQYVRIRRRSGAGARRSNTTSPRAWTGRSATAPPRITTRSWS